MSKRWYVVQAFSGYEKSVMRSLHEQIALHGMEERFGDILVPTEEVVEMKEAKSVRVSVNFIRATFWSIWKWMTRRGIW